MALVFVGCSDSQSISTDPQSQDTFADALLSFPIPEGGTVQRAAENSYLVFFGEEMYYLMHRGAAEPDDFGRQRAEASRTETTANQGKPVDDGQSVVTVGEISEVTRHEINSDPVYLFSHAATAETEGESGIGYNTIGFGSVDGVAIWFQHTSARNDDHPRSVLGFLETVTFKQGEQDTAEQPAPNVESE
ncbi:MAG: hypothetical protein AAGA96_13005 [Verrucomicrobiota bacterium]